MTDYAKNAMKIFETPNTIEKWVSFIELTKLIDQIKKNWLDRLFSKVEEYFNLNESKNKNWKFKRYERDLRWHIGDFSDESICICLEIDPTMEHFSFSLWLGAANNQRVRKELKAAEFYPLTEKFINGEYPLAPNGYYVIENVNWGFDENEMDYLAWEAGNSTEIFLQKIIVKIDAIRMDKRYTQLLRKINEKAFPNRLL